jgi:hypothetical protein
MKLDDNDDGTIKGANISKRTSDDDNIIMFFLFFGRVSESKSECESE